MPGWVQDVAPKHVISSSQFGNPIRDRVIHQFNSVAERDATARPVVGMMCYCLTEATYYAYLYPKPWYNVGAPPLGPLWCIWDTGWVAWPAELWSGPTTNWGGGSNRWAGYRRTFGQCDFFAELTSISYTDTIGTDLIYIPMPTPPAHDPAYTPGTIPVKGTCGTMQIQDETKGVLGPFAMFDETHIACGLLHLEGAGVADHTNLVVRADLTTPAGSHQLNVYARGSYPCGLT